MDSGELKGRFYGLAHISNSKYFCSRLINVIALRKQSDLVQ